MTTPRTPDAPADPSPDRAAAACPSCGVRASTLDALAAVASVRPPLAHLVGPLLDAVALIRANPEGEPDHD